MQLGNDIMKMCTCLPDYVDVISDMAKQSKKFVPPCNFTQHVKCVAQVIRKFRSGLKNESQDFKLPRWPASQNKVN